MKKIKRGQLIQSKKGGRYNNYMIDDIQGSLLKIRNIANGRTVFLMNEKDYSRYNFNQ